MIHGTAEGADRRAVRLRPAQLAERRARRFLAALVDVPYGERASLGGKGESAVPLPSKPVTVVTNMMMRL